MVEQGTSTGNRRAAAAMTLAVLAAATCAMAAAGPPRPRYPIDLSNPYTTTATPRYAGNHEAVYTHIDSHHADHVEAIRRWLRQPSVSAYDDGVTDMAEMVRSDLAALGFHETALIPTDGHPGVWGYFDAGADRTLMVYMMYDVQPVDAADWESPPFAAAMVDKPEGRAVMARGAINQKGPERAFLNAVESVLAVEGNLPVNLMITAEGEEELGSVHYPQIVDRYESRLRTAQGVIFPMPSQSPDGQVTVTLGVKGIVYFEIEARGGEWGGPTRAEVHGSYKAIIDSPVWRLIGALGALVTEDGNTITVPGYYDAVRPPTAEEQRLIAGYLTRFDEQALRRQFAVSGWLDGLSGVDLLHEMIYTPTLNIDGIWAGYTGPGTKTILPYRATAKVDSRLPLGLDPDTALRSIRSHLDSAGYADIEIRKLGGYPAAQTSVSAPLVQAAIGVYHRYAPPPAVNPRLAGSAPFYQFTERLGLPMIPMGLGYGTGAHAPNEYLVIESAGPVAGLADIERAYVDLLYAFARAR